MINVTDLLKLGVERNASDIFISVGIRPTLKINGVMHPLNEDVMTPDDTAVMIDELLSSPKDKARYENDGEADFSISLPGVGRYRVAVYRQRNSKAAVIRILSFNALDIPKLKIPKEVLDLNAVKKGLVLVTGPTGSGKSTTLAALISLINKNRSCHIITIEDPIEFLFKHDKSIVDQREIGSDTKSYAHALRSSLRQAPDVILIGEMRDYETISVALTAAETGHLVLSSLHTTSASKTIDRIIDVFPPEQQHQVRIQLSTVLMAVVSQQLVPTVEGERVASFEVMKVNNAIRNLIRDAKVPQIDAMIQTGKSEGMINMDSYLAELFKSGVISQEMAIKHASNPTTIGKYFR